MKDTILNVVYDTDTADNFGSRVHSGDRSAQEYFEEGLYRNKSGYWFIAGWGGNRTRFAVETTPGRRCGGAGIIPIGCQAAMNWLAENGNVQALRNLFPTQKEYLKETYGLRL